MSGVDDVEHTRLLEVIALAERIQGRAVPVGKSPLPASMLAGLADGAKIRVADLEQHGILHGGDERKDRAKIASEAIALYVAINEPHLSRAEKQTLSGFLERDFFTRNDFPEIEQFYGSAWDRLSDPSKAALSTRVWTSIRQDEFTFLELPEDVRRKEAEFLYQQLVGSEQLPPTLEAIPQKDRTEFVSNFKAGNHTAADEILNRDVFKENVSLAPTAGTQQKKVSSAAHAQDKPAAQQHGIKKGADKQQQDAKEQEGVSLNVGSLDFSNFSADSQSVKAADLPIESNRTRTP